MQNVTWRLGNGTLPLYLPASVVLLFILAMNSVYYTDTNSYVWVLPPQHKAILLYQLGVLQFSSVLILLWNQTWVCLPHAQQSQSTDTGLWKSKVQCFVQGIKQRKEKEQLVLKRPELLPQWVSGKVF